MDRRARIYEVIEVAGENDRISYAYDLVVMVSVFLNLVPLAFKETNLAFEVISGITGAVFILDYILRLITADYKMRQGAKSFLRYPFTPMAIIDFISILPSFTPMRGAFRMLRIVRLLKTIRVFRIFKMLRYSRSLTIITNVIRSQRAPLLAVCSLAVAYVLIAALIIFNVEPATFDTFFDAVYWAVVSLTTVGYGDIYPVSVTGRTVAMVSAFFGIAVVALPAGIITAGYMDELNRSHGEKREDAAEGRADRNAAEKDAGGPGVSACEEAAAAVNTAVGADAADQSRL